MKTLFSGAFAAAFLLSGPALADEAKQADQSQPIQLTAAQMDTVTAGAGLKVKNPKAAVAAGGVPPWSKLFLAGFSADDTLITGLSGVVVLVPR